MKVISRTVQNCIYTLYFYLLSFYQQLVLKIHFPKLVFQSIFIIIIIIRNNVFVRQYWEWCRRRSTATYTNARRRRRRKSIIAC